jgi:polysaccharide deacetylase family protein (PEP-CTERM system associated)
MYTNKIALSFDIEDWFTVRNMRESLNDQSWDDLEFRVDIGLNFILEELAKRNIKATFFVLGWVAEKAPQLIHKIALHGHEIGTHGFSHTPIDLMNPEEFKADLEKSINIIESITNTKVKGFRAPSFSVTKETLWALDIIRDLGLTYDSSIFSTMHPDYGINNFPTQVTELKELIEVPMKKGNFFGIKLPFCGGGYFRMLPYFIIKNSMKQTIKNESFVMYFHPWEFDESQPRVNMPVLKKFRHYVGLKSNRKKFTKMLDEFDFTTVDDLINLEYTKNNIQKLSSSQIGLLN